MKKLRQLLPKVFLRTNPNPLIPACITTVRWASSVLLQWTSSNKRHSNKHSARYYTHILL